MPMSTPPTAILTGAQRTWDGGRECFDVVITSDDVHDLFDHKHLYVLEDEQRGNDPVTSREVISEDKLERWVQMELSHQFHIGQLTACVRSEIGSTVEFDEDTGTLRLHGDLVLADSRQRVYTLVRCVEGRRNGNGYQARAVSMRIYPETTPEYRKRVFYEYNQEGDHADESRSKWLAPKGFAQDVAKRLVENSPHLTHENVNVVRNRVTSKDPRLAGFNTFASAVEAAWNRVVRNEGDVEDVSAFLIRFWDKLVEVLPDLGVKTLPERREIREQSLVGTAVTIYGYLAVAAAIYKRDGKDASLDLLKDLDDPSWFDVNADHWKENGVVVPRRDRRSGEIKGWRVAMSYQTRSAMADAMLDKMGFSEADTDSDA